MTRSRLTGGITNQSSSWVIPGFVFVAMVGGALLPLIWRLPAKVHNGLILAGLFYVGGGLGMELIGGMLDIPERITLGRYE